MALIDREALIKKMFPYGNICDWNYSINAKAARVAIDNMPVVDAVEVVRCKDCRYARPDVLLANMYCCIHAYGVHSFDHYCGYGEKEIDR